MLGVLLVALEYLKSCRKKLLQVRVIRIGD